MRRHSRVISAAWVLGLSAVAACSSKDRTVQVASTGGAAGAGTGAMAGSSATGGTGGGTGGTGGTGATGGTSGTGGGGTVCGGANCPEYTVGGLVPMPACCSSNNKCGSVVDATAAGPMGDVPLGCYEADQAGDQDCACPGHTFGGPTSPAAFITFPGCCTPVGKCGYLIDLTNSFGPKIGCHVATFGAGSGKQCTVGSPVTSCLDAGL